MICANCCRDLHAVRCTGQSGLYYPNNDKGIELCEPCFLEEDELIEELGTNDQPERLARYLDNIARR